MLARILYCSTMFLLCISTTFSMQTQIYYLSGRDKDHTVDWDFFCTDGRNSGEWSTIPVPSHWELQGFGHYNYGHDKNKEDEKGIYKYQFRADREWRGQNVFLVFEGSMTDTEVKLNGKSAGEKHQGAFYRFQYNLTQLIRYEEPNELEVIVSKQSSNPSVNAAERQADYWVFGGIFRPVYLKIVPEYFIERVAIDARANGMFKMDAFLTPAEGMIVRAQIKTLDDKPVGSIFSKKVDATQITLNTRIPETLSWSCEFPNLYKVSVSLMKDGKILHTLDERFGFRTVELKKGNGLYVNGRKIMFKGVNRHSFWPNSGRCLSRQLSIPDVTLMKDMNMNAVRMSHYPPDKHFLEVCDSLGLFVLNELAGWQDSYDTPIGEKLVKEMVTRDVNHPCVILWDNGNEGGNNTELDDDFAKYDPQNRPVIHPWEIFNGTDTQHYKSFNYGPGSVFHGREVFFPTEFLHGLYDGGHGAGLDDYWNLMMEHPLSAGGFLWDFADEAVVRTDKKGVLDTDKNHAADGILGPYREKEASFYTIKEIWSPIFINKRFITKHFDGRILLENRYFYTTLNECQFIRKLVDFSGPFEPSAGHQIRLKKTLHSPAIQPGERGLLDLDLPQDWQSYDALYLTAIDPHGRMIYTWSFPIKTPREMTESIIENNSPHNIKVEQDLNLLYLSSGDTQIRIDKQTGMLMQVENCKSLISFTNGPKPNHKDLVLKSLKHFRHNNDYIVEIDYEEGLEKLVWTLKRNGWLKLEYSYQPARGEYDVLGINFNYPEEKVTGMKWLGRGPYRVWKNRLKGQMFDVWSKQYNNTVTGESWNYPEFKGYHAEFNWVVIENTESPFIIATSTPDLFLRVFTPQPPAGAYNDHTSPSFPAGDISILHGIDAIGTKFKPPELLGPASMKNRYEGHGKNTLSACLFFYFGHMD